MGRNAAVIVLAIGGLALTLPGAVGAQVGAPAIPGVEAPPIPGMAPAMPGMAPAMSGMPHAMPGMPHALPGVAAPGVPPGVAGYHMVRPGETLDMIIARTLGQHPFRPAFVREVFVRMNPQAFIQNNPNRLLAGAALAIPDTATLRDLAFPALRAAEQAQHAQAAGGQGGAQGGQHGASRGPAAPDEHRRRWIRYP